MKVLPTNFALYNTQRQSKQYKNTENSTDYNKMNNLNEVIGRSLVSFKGQQLNKQDQTFIDVIADTFRLNDKRKEILSQSVKKFLREERLNNLEGIGRDDGKYYIFLNNVSGDLNLTRNELEFLRNELISRIDDGKKYGYAPIVYFKDFEVLEKFREEKGLTTETASELIENMEIEATKQDYKTLFDIFKQKSNMKNSKTVNYILNEMDLSQDKAVDLLLDLTKMAEMDDAERIQKFQQEGTNDELARKLKLSSLVKYLTYAFELDTNERNDEYQKMVDICADRYFGSANDMEEKSIDETAYRLCELFDLPAENFSDIVAVIQIIEKQSINWHMNNLRSFLS